MGSLRHWSSSDQVVVCFKHNSNTRLKYPLPRDVYQFRSACIHDVYTVAPRSVRQQIYIPVTWYLSLENVLNRFRGGQVA